MKTKITCISVITAILMIIFQGASNATTAVVKTDGLNLRKESSADSGIIEVLNINDNINVISEEGEWYKVEHNGNSGYVKKQYVDIKEENISEETPVDIASPTEENEQPTDEGKNVPIDAIEGNTITINQDKKVRIIPVINSNIIGELKTGSKLEIISQVKNWVFIQNDEISGWIIYNQTVQESNEKETVPTEGNNQNELGNQNENNEENNINNNEPNNSENTNKYEPVTKYVKGTSIYLREGPSTETKALTTLTRNTDVKVIGEENGWYKVQYEDITGYIREDLLTDNKVVETSREGENIERTSSTNVATGAGNDIVNFAYGYLGCPYVYGGSGPSTFDCSGFTAYVYNHFRYSLPHSAVSQMDYGVEVSSDNLQPGDLVFFLDYQTMDGVGHCGIYIGNGEFIHASSGTGYCVKTSTLETGSYKTRYYTARRLI